MPRSALFRRLPWGPPVARRPCRSAMMRGLSVALAAALLGTAVPPAAAQDPIIPRAVLPGIGAADPRRPVAAAEAPWRALGRVQTELGGRCTGTLIGPATVLTAAHCLVAPRTGRVVQPGSVHFLLGYDRGRWVAQGRVAAMRLGPGYAPDGQGPRGADWAVLTLERPLAVPPDRILPLRLPSAPPPRTALVLGGYQQDRPEVLLADTGCRVLGLDRDSHGLPLLIHDCAGTRGASGAPVLARGPAGGWEVVAVVSAVAIDAALGAAVPAFSITLP